MHVQLSMNLLLLLLKSSKITNCFATKFSDIAFIMLINVEMPAIVGILKKKHLGA